MQASWYERHFNVINSVVSLGFVALIAIGFALHFHASTLAVYGVLLAANLTLRLVFPRAIAWRNRRLQ